MNAATRKALLDGVVFPSDLDEALFVLHAFLDCARALSLTTPTHLEAQAYADRVRTLSKSLPIVVGIRRANARLEYERSMRDTATAVSAGLIPPRSIPEFKP